MMSKIVSKIALFLMMSCLNIMALADQNVFIKKKPSKFFAHIDIGVSLPRTSRKSDADAAFHYESIPSHSIGSIGLKYALSPNVKLGLSFVQRFAFLLKGCDDANNLVEKRIQISSIMVNGSYDLPILLQVLFPYLELGVGASRISSGKIMAYKERAKHLKREADLKYTLTMVASLGAYFKLSESSMVGIKYTYARIGKIKQKLSVPPVTRTFNEGMLVSNDFLASIIFNL